MKQRRLKQFLAVLLTLVLGKTSVEWSGIAGMIHKVSAQQTENETKAKFDP